MTFIFWLNWFILIFSRLGCQIPDSFGMLVERCNGSSPRSQTKRYRCIQVS